MEGRAQIENQFWVAIGYYLLDRGRFAAIVFHGPVALDELPVRSPRFEFAVAHA
jgi:hypothetical protein